MTKKRRVPRKRSSKRSKKKEVSKIPSKSQTWSVDVLIAASVFIVGIIIFFYIVTYSGGKGAADELATESELIPEVLISSDEDSAGGSTLVVGNKVDSERLKELINKSYDEFKDELGITSDFCIHFEDEDGNIIDLDDDPTRTKYSIGNPRLNLTFVDENGQKVVVPCGS